jgi:hypothetical protein
MNQTNNNNSPCIVCKRHIHINGICQGPIDGAFICCWEYRRSG